MKALTLILTTFLYSQICQAGVFIKAAELVLSDTDETSETASTTNADTFMDFHLGWMTTKGFGIAATMSTHSEENTVKTAASEFTTSVEKSSTGVTLGWANKKT
jgi:hypothetical protein